MKYIPKDLTGNVNVSTGHPLAELAWLTGGLVLLVAVVYAGFWLVAELVVPRVPVDVEVWAGRQMMRNASYRENKELARILNRLLERLPLDSPLRRYQFTVSVVENKDVNAIALPGGHIVVFSGLLKEVCSANEMAMILGHELGHYAHRDHLRGLGRGLGVTLAIAMLFGQQSQAATLASDMFLGMEMRYSQKQESAADAFGLATLVAGYGHAGGAADFFARLSRKTGGRYTYVLASHPHPGDRIAALNSMIAAKGYPVRAPVPLQRQNLGTEKHSLGRSKADVMGKHERKQGGAVLQPGIGRCQP